MYLHTHEVAYRYDFIGLTIAMVTVGGVIEDNEVFGNKFDGICLATGVNPKLKGEQ